MQKDEKQSNTAKSTVIAKEQLQQKFNSATSELLDWIDYDPLKKVVDHLLIGWLSSEELDQMQSIKKVNTYTFFNEFLMHFEKADKEYRNDRWTDRNLNFPLEYYDLFSLDAKYYRKCLKEAIYIYLCTDFANNLTQREDVIYFGKKIEEYLKKIYRIKSKYNLQIS